MKNMILSFVASVAFPICLVGCAEPPPAPTDVTTISQGLVQPCMFEDNPVGTNPALHIAIDPAKELVILSRGIVDDPCRTSWTTTGCTDLTKLGKWTFGRLMTVMSGATNETDPQARKFVVNWLKLWMSNQPVGTDVGTNSVPARPDFKSKLLDPWLAGIAEIPGNTCPTGTALEDCPELLKYAPFRLLAIVNRIDMSGSIGYGFTSPGELRFVYGATVTPITSMKPAPIAQYFTVILEYKFPTKKSALEWAKLFHDLSDPTLSLPLSPIAVGSPTPTLFANKLQAITDMVVEPGAQLGNPNNGSSIGQIRTDDGAFLPPTLNSDLTMTTHWEFRQFELSCTTTPCQLKQVPVSQTPSSRIANSTSVGGIDPLSKFIRENQETIAISNHIVPTSLLGGSSTSDAPNAVTWAVPNPLDLVNNPTDDVALTKRALVRHNFGFSTCNGCHYRETNNTNLLFHLRPRNDKATSSPSMFIGLASPLTIDPETNIPATIDRVADPDGTFHSGGGPIEFEYNEPWRRACEIRRIIAGNTTASSTATGHNSPPKNSCHLNNACGTGTGVCFCDAVCTSYGDCCPDGPC